jgi:hypothetical protein
VCEHRAVIAELRPRLYRWTAPHPAWTPDAEPGGPLDWPRLVGSVAVATDGGLVLIDAQLPPDPAAIWPELDRLVAAHGPAVTVLTTMRFHRRSWQELVERYGARHRKARDADIPGVEPFVVPDADEAMLWLPGPRALVPGDRLIGDGAGGVRACPASWLGYLPAGLDVDGLKERLRPLLELPVELVLVTHGEPVLEDGHAALSKALA